MTTTPPPNIPLPGSQITSWLPVFDQYLEHVRIPSKEMERLDVNDPGVPILPLWGSQRLYMTELAEGLDRGVRTFFFLKNRQAGISTISLALDLFWLAWFPGTQGALIADTEGNLRKFRFTMKQILRAFPSSFFGSSFAITKGADNRDLMGFTNGSSLDLLVAGKARGANRNKTLGESRGYNFCHCSEVANWGSSEGIQSFRETLAERHPSRLYIWESTAKGFNTWHALYGEGLQDKLTKKSIFIGWWAVEKNAYRAKGPEPEPRLLHIYGSQPMSPEEREKAKIVLQRHGHVITPEQLAWYRHRQADTSLADEDLKQNQPWYAEEAFILTGHSFFQIRLVQKHLKHLYESPDEQAYLGYKFHLANNFMHCKMEQILRDKSLVQLKVWEEPSKSGTYTIGVDPAWGRGEARDRHAISVWRCYADCIVQVAEWVSPAVDTRQAAWVLAYLAGAYRNSTLNIEISGGGGLAILSEFKSLRMQLQTQAFPETRRDSQWEDFLAQARWFVYRRYDSQSGASNVTQWSTTRQNKFEIMNQLRDTMAKQELFPHSISLLEEMTYVVQTESSIEAPGRNKDDRVMAAALAIRTWIDALRPALLHAHATYDAVQAAESTEQPTGVEDMANRMVKDFFKRAEEKAAEGPQPPAWMRQRGLATILACGMSTGLLCLGIIGRI